MSRLFYWLLALALWLLRKEAMRLNLFVTFDEHDILLDDYREFGMAKIGDSFTARIAPTNSAGAPAPVFSVEYFEDGDCYDFTVSPDGLTAVFTAVAAGTGNAVRVSAVTKGGATLFETVALPDVESPVDEEAVALNLTVA